MAALHKITPFLWFDDQAEEAARFYTSVFKTARITQVSHYAKATEAVSGKQAGSVMTVAFELEGQSFVALNGGPQYRFSPAVSFVVNCGSQDEVDALWGALSEGGEPRQCGWLTDKFGVTWQIVPTVLPRLLSDPARAERVMQALLKMTRIDIAALEAA